jgi:hypothetical protein
MARIFLPAMALVILAFSVPAQTAPDTAELTRLLKDFPQLYAYVCEQRQRLEGGSDALEPALSARQAL